MLLRIDVRGESQWFVDARDVPELVVALLDAAQGAAHVCPRGACFCE